MVKNIILCSDGTGNKGGDGVGTNVYKLYNAVDIHDGENPQITFYDNGVGTSKNKYIRALTGAFGVGFKQNVEDLYEFLARNYATGDQIYVFGFSRGAATVRAFAGMVQWCGLLDTKDAAYWQNGNFDETKFQCDIDAAMRAYKKIRKNPSIAKEFKSQHSVKDDKFAPDGDLKIKFIGVWDTVSALGFPQDWSWAVNWIFALLEKILDWLWPHSFYEYQLNRSVEFVYHALAIDDERKTFHPQVWNEILPDRPKKIEQVWFSGAHSNVGGGYPRAGLSTVALDWMMTRAQHHGVAFNNFDLSRAQETANVHGKLYDSRDGAAVYYRYSPRDIETLCTNRKGERKIARPVKFHKSVIERIEMGTSRYAPGFLPYEFLVTETPINVQPVPMRAAASQAAWKAHKKEIGLWVAVRKTLYRLFVETTVITVAVTTVFYLTDQKASGGETAPASAYAPAYIFSRQMLEDVFTNSVVSHPAFMAVIAALFIGYYVLRGNMKARTQAACEKARISLLDQWSQKTAGTAP